MAAGKKKKAAKKTARKATATKKGAAKKKAVRKAAPKAKPAPRTTARSPEPAPSPAPAATPGGHIAAVDVNLGHIAALRPRTHTGFKPEAFQDAKRELAEARYASIEEAARAVAEKAVELSNKSGASPFTNH